MIRGSARAERRRVRGNKIARASAYKRATVDVGHEVRCREHRALVGRVTVAIRWLAGRTSERTRPARAHRRVKSVRRRSRSCERRPSGDQGVAADERASKATRSLWRLVGQRLRLLSRVRYSIMIMSTSSDPETRRSEAWQRPGLAITVHQRRARAASASYEL